MPDYVRYSFGFWEDGTGSGGGVTEVAVETGTSGGGTGDGTASAGGQTAVCTVRKGDTLWGKMCIRDRAVPLLGGAGAGTGGGGMRELNQIRDAVVSAVSTATAATGPAYRLARWSG